MIVDDNKTLFRFVTGSGPVGPGDKLNDYSNYTVVNPVHVLEQRTVFNKKDFSLKIRLIKNNSSYNFP